MPEGLESPNPIGNISKPDPIRCLPACKIQNNPNQMTYAPYPQEENFFYQGCRQNQTSVYLLVCHVLFIAKSAEESCTERCINMTNQQINFSC